MAAEKISHVDCELSAIGIKRFCVKTSDKIKNKNFIGAPLAIVDLSNSSARAEDFSNISSRWRTSKAFRKHLKNAPFLFDTSDWLGFFERLGFLVNEKISALDESVKVNRPFPMPLLFKI